MFHFIEIVRNLLRTQNNHGHDLERLMVLKKSHTHIFRAKLVEIYGFDFLTVLE